MCGKHYADWKRAGGLGVQCDETDCSQFAMTRGKCNTHYAALRRRGEADNPCSVPDCEGGALNKGYCGSHFYRVQNGLQLDAEWRRAGEWQAWETTSKGYVRRRRTNQDGVRENQWQHRWVVEQAIGRELYRHEEIHHKNGNRADNRWPENLEIWSTSQPKGQRVGEKVEWALEILKLYRPDLLA